MIIINAIGNDIEQNTQNCGVCGEGNSTVVKISFNDDWAAYNKKVVFYNAKKQNGVAVLLTSALKIDETNKETYQFSVPPEPLEYEGEIEYVIDGVIKEGEETAARKKSIAGKLRVRYAPDSVSDEISGGISLTQAEQLQEYVETVENKNKEYSDEKSAAAVAAAKAYTEEVAANKVDKVVGKGLSTEDYTLEEKTKLAEYPDTYADLDDFILGQIDGSETLTKEYALNRAKEAEATAKAYADEVATAAEDYADKVASANGAASKTFAKNYTDNVAANKVDKVTGKGLSTEDYTTTDKTKLAEYPDYADFAESIGDNIDLAETTAKAYADELAEGKVDKVSGKGLSTEDYTTEEKTKLSTYPDDYSDLEDSVSKQIDGAHSDALLFAGNFAEAAEYRSKAYTDEKSAAAVTASRAFAKNYADGVIPHTTASGYPLTLTDALQGKKLLGCKIWGGCGKNLIPYPYADTTKTVNGVTFTDNGDGTVTINGTATGITYFFFMREALLNGTYTLSGSVGGSKSTYLLGLGSSDNADIGNGTTASFDGSQTNNIFIKVMPGAVVENVTVKPQLELGQSATAYEKYKEVGDLNSSDGKYHIPVCVTSNNTQLEADIVLDTPLSSGEYVDLIRKKRVSGSEETDITVTGELKTVGETNVIMCAAAAAPQKIEAEYYQDINKTITEIKSAISALDIPFEKIAEVTVSEADIMEIRINKDLSGNNLQLKEVFAFIEFGALNSSYTFNNAQCSTSVLWNGEGYSASNITKYRSLVDAAWQKTKRYGYVNYLIDGKRMKGASYTSSSAGTFYVSPAGYPLNVAKEMANEADYISELCIWSSGSYNVTQDGQSVAFKPPIPVGTKITVWGKKL